MDLNGWVSSRGGLLIPSSAMRYDRPVGVDLFAGAGGFSCGFHEAGFHMAAAVENTPDAALTYLVNLARPGVRMHFDTPEREAEWIRVLERHLGISGRGRRAKYAGAGKLAGDGWIRNRPSSERGCEQFFYADVRNVTGEQILDALSLRRGEVGAVVGGPPCQGFSKANAGRSVMDPRNSLVFEFARLVVEIAPKTMVMENVPQVATMLTPEGVPVIDAFARVLADGGFSTYNALKSSLAAQAGTGALMRRDSGPSGDEPEDDGEAIEDEQLSLLEMGALMPVPAGRTP